MKITKKQLQVIIREELEQVMSEQGGMSGTERRMRQHQASVDPRVKQIIAYRQSPEFEERATSGGMSQGEIESTRTRDIETLRTAAPRGISVPAGSPTPTGRGTAEDPFVTPGGRKGMEESLINDITESVLAKLIKK